jgi:hypothetical protein
LSLPDANAAGIIAQCASGKKLNIRKSELEREHAEFNRDLCFGAYVELVDGLKATNRRG